MLNFCAIFGCLNRSNRLNPSHYMLMKIVLTVTKKIRFLNFSNTFTKHKNHKNVFNS